MTGTPRGFLASLAVHGLVLAALLWPRRPKPVILEELPPSGPIKVQFQPEGHRAPAGRADDAPRPQPSHHPPRAAPRVNVARAEPIATPPKDTAEPEPEVVDDGPPDVPVEAEPGTGESVGGLPGIGVGFGGGGGSGPVPFEASMTPPRKISGPDPSYTVQALEREVQGIMLVRCIVGLDGSVRDCRVVRGLPFMDRAVLDALERRRYSPATLAGRPVEVDYTFRIELRLP
jgi:protein TonB